MLHLPDTALTSLCHKTKAEAAGKGKVWSDSGCKWSRPPSAQRSDSAVTTTDRTWHIM